MWLSQYQEACIALARPWVPVQHLKIFTREEHLNETHTENRCGGQGCSCVAGNILGRCKPLGSLAVK